MAFVVLLPTRLPELTVPEALAATNFCTKVLKLVNNGMHVLYGDNNIISVDTHPPKKPDKVRLLGKPVSLLFLDPKEDYGKKNHGLKRETESRTHRRELGKRDYSISRNRSPL
jgi:hypothetical protein